MKNITRLAGGAAAVVATLWMTTAVAFAQAVTPDPSGGAFTTGVNDVKSNISGTYAAPLFALVAIAVGIGVGLAWLRRAKSHASA